MLLGLALEHLHDALQAVGIDIVEHELVRGQHAARTQQRAVDERDAEPAATD